MFPFNWWVTCMQVGFEGIKLVLHVGQMAVASPAVVIARTGIIGDAVRRPLDGDYAEMSQMVTEKMVGFSQAWAGAIQDLWKLQIGWLTLGTGLPALFDMGAKGKKHRAHALKESARLLQDGSGLAGRAMAPLHSRVTANAKRLQRTPSRRKPARAAQAPD